MLPKVKHLVDALVAASTPHTDVERPTLDRVADFYAHLHPAAVQLAPAFMAFWPKFLDFSGRSAYPRSLNWRTVARSYFDEHWPKWLAQDRPLPATELPISDTAFATLMSQLPRTFRSDDAALTTTNQRPPPACAPATPEYPNCSQVNAPEGQCESKGSRPVTQEPTPPARTGAEPSPG